MKAVLFLCCALAVIGAAVWVALKLLKATRIWPAAMLIVSAPLEVYRSSSGAGMNLSLFRLALLLGVAALAVDILRGRVRAGRTMALSLAIYGAFLAWQLTSLLFVTPAHALAYRFLGQYAGGLLAAVVIVAYVRRSDLAASVALYAGGALLPLVAAAYRVFSVSHGGNGDLPGLSSLPLDPAIQAARKSGSFLLDGTQRLNATFSDPNHFGFYIATVLLVAAGAAYHALFVQRQGRAWIAASYLLLAVAAAIAAVGTYSRSSWLMAAMGTLVLAAVLGRSAWTRRRALYVGGGGMLAFAAASPLIVSRLSLSSAGNVKSDQVHERTMSLALRLLGHHPLLGVGLGDYGRHAGQPALVSSAHSTFLTVASELGIVGAALLLGAIAVASAGAFRHARRAPTGKRALVGALAASYVGLAVANVLYEVWMDDFQWVLFGLVLAHTAQSTVSLRRLPGLPRRRPRVEGAERGPGEADGQASEAAATC